MTRLEKIEQSIMSLSPDERKQLGDWFDTVRGAEFDASIGSDAANGHLDDLAKEALAEYRAGRVTPLERR